MQSGILVIGFHVGPLIPGTNITLALSSMLESVAPQRYQGDGGNPDYELFLQLFGDSDTWNFILQIGWGISSLDIEMSLLSNSLP